MTINNGQDKRWSSLKAEEKLQNEGIYRAIRKFSVKIANQYNNMLYNWLVYLNAGGLIGILTLLKFEKNNCGVLSLCFIAVLFFIGVISIMYAAIQERDRFTADSDRTSDEFERLKNGDISEENFKSSISKDSSSTKRIHNAERLSLVLFTFGVILAIVNVYCSRNDICNCSGASLQTDKSNEVLKSAQ